MTGFLLTVKRVKEIFMLLEFNKRRISVAKDSNLVEYTFSRTHTIDKNSRCHGKTYCMYCMLSKSFSRSGERKLALCYSVCG